MSNKYPWVVPSCFMFFRRNQYEKRAIFDRYEIRPDFHQVSVRFSRLKQLISLRFLINLNIEMCEFDEADKTFVSDLYLILMNCTLRHGDHVRGTWTKEYHSFVCGTNKAVKPLSFESQGICCKSSIQTGAESSSLYIR